MRLFDNHIYIPKMEEIYIKDLLETYEIVGIRKGEKLREDLIGDYEDEMDEGDYWKI